MPPKAQLLAAPGLYVELERRSNPALLAEKFKSVTRLADIVRRDASRSLAVYAVYRVAEPIGDVLGP